MENKNAEIQSLVIIGKKWFERVNGNTYHSVRVILNGKEIGYIPFEYGYGEQYKYTALEILQKNGYFNTGERYENGYSKDQENFSKFQRDNYETCLFYCTDVQRKKDL